MAGNDHREIIGRTCAGNRPHRSRFTNATSDLGVGNRLTNGNLPERLPYTMLKNGAADVQGKVETNCQRLNETDDPSNEDFVVTVRSDEASVGKTILQTADEFVRIVSKQNRGDT